MLASVTIDNRAGFRICILVFVDPSLNRRTKRGAGGLLLYIKKELQEGVQVLPRGKEQDRMWIVLDKTAFGLERDTYVGFFYIPPVTSCNVTKGSGVSE